MHPADVPEDLRLAEMHGTDALALISRPSHLAHWTHCEDCHEVYTLVYWRARLAARHAARYLAEERTK